MAVRIAEVLAGAGDLVQFVAGNVVAEQVAAVVGEPQALRPRLPVEADRVADAAGHVFPAAAVGVHADQLAVCRRRVADVARRTDRHVQLAVRAERDELPAVVRLGGQLVGDYRGLGRVVQVVLDVAQHQDPAHRGNVQIAALERHAHRQLQAAGDHPHLLGDAVAVRVGQRVDLAGAVGADEHRALRAQRDLARVRHLVGIDGDMETRRQGQPVQRQRGLHRQGQDHQQQRQQQAHGNAPWRGEVAGYTGARAARSGGAL